MRGCTPETMELVWFRGLACASIVLIRIDNCGLWRGENAQLITIHISISIFKRPVLVPAKAVSKRFRCSSNEEGNEIGAKLYWAPSM